MLNLILRFFSILQIIAPLFHYPKFSVKTGIDVAFQKGFMHLQKIDILITISLLELKADKEASWIIRLSVATNLNGHSFLSEWYQSILNSNC